MWKMDFFLKRGSLEAFQRDRQTLWQEKWLVLMVFADAFLLCFFNLGGVFRGR